MSLTSPQEWLEKNFALIWPKGVPPKDFRKAIDMVTEFGQAIGLARSPAAPPPPVTRLPELRREAKKKKGNYRPKGLKEKGIKLLKEGEYTASEFAKALGASDSYLTVLGKQIGARRIERPGERIKYTLMPASPKAPVAVGSRKAPQRERVLEALRKELLKGAPVSLGTVRALFHPPPRYQVLRDAARSLGATLTGKGSVGRWTLGPVVTKPDNKTRQKESPKAQKILQELASGAKTLHELAKLSGSSVRYVSKVHAKHHFKEAGRRGSEVLWTLNGTSPSAVQLPLS